MPHLAILSSAHKPIDKRRDRVHRSLMCGNNHINLLFSLPQIDIAYLRPRQAKSIDGISVGFRVLIAAVSGYVGLDDFLLWPGDRSCEKTMHSLHWAGQNEAGRLPEVCSEAELGLGECTAQHCRRYSMRCSVGDRVHSRKVLNHTLSSPGHPHAKKLNHVRPARNNDLIPGIITCHSSIRAL